MKILLHHSGDFPDSERYDIWIAVAGARPALPPDREIENVAERLETSFDAMASEWLDLARDIGSEPSAELTHLTACATNVSDFGEMLAWTHVVNALGENDNRRVLVVCDDPWLFRHIAAQGQVSAGAPPALLPRCAKLILRGYVARLWYALRAGSDAILMRDHRKNTGTGGAWLIVYGHPYSDPTERDGYFGDLPKTFPGLKRALHVDCGRKRARELARGSRVVSLRGWGSPLQALRLPFVRWRPRRKTRQGRFGWLIRRAAALEAGTAQAAAIRWQILCQKTWLGTVRPGIVAWPWEHHAWERALVREGRKTGIRTLAYQHSVVGRQMLNYSPRSCPDGSSALPDRILCTGRSTRDRLVRWNVPEDRIAIGGALRFSQPARVQYDPRAPVFVALPFDHLIAAEMMDAVEACGETSLEFVVRDHPMTPFNIRSNIHIRRADGPLGEQRAISAVVYAATTVGLEALVAGLPVLRFRSRSRLSVDILPQGYETPETDLRSLPNDLSKVTPPAPADREYVFATPDMALWRSYLEIG